MGMGLQKGGDFVIVSGSKPLFDGAVGNKVMKANPPLGLLLIAILLLVDGGWGVVETVFSLANGSGQIRLEFIGIFLGRGLLMGKERSRFWTMILAATLTVLTPLLTAWLHGSGKLDVDGGMFLWLMLATIVPLAVFLVMQSTAAKAWCQSDKEVVATDMRMAMLFCLVGMFAGVVLNLQEMEHARVLKEQRQLFQQSFEINTRFFARTVDGQPIKNGLAYTGLIGTDETGKFPTTIHVTADVKDELWLGHWVTGKAATPLKVTFGAEGYQPVSYFISNGSPREVVLTLVSESQAERKAE